MTFDHKTSKSSFSRCAAVAGSALLSFAFLAGCTSANQKAIDQAKAQAASTNIPQQVQYVNSSGETVTTTVQPPPTPGAAEQISTTVTPPPAGAPKPAATQPMVSAVAAPPPADMLSANGNAPAQGDNLNNAVASYPVNGGTSTQPAPQGAPQPAANYAPQNVSVPSGTELAIRINQTINVKHAFAGERFTGEVAEPISRGGTVIVPRGTPVAGRIDEAHRRGHFKGASVLELRLTTMTLNGNTYSLDTREHVNAKRGKGRRTAGFIGGMTGVGMLIGGVATGGVGLAIGGAAGAGAGTLLAGTTGNRDIVLPAESVVHFRLADDLVVQY
ncbi:hypothetical protein SAMN05421819_2895 [Bryocella elongata]|uniref:Uncharacterized protein n=1 Tax=Bryocella elongata TaxID=863522 RepID=A0A1H6A4Q3_9BACT|nr:hypothetical protein [Bryocella elongata]SEG43055.1 hypothetical protein SAMN05421819_2895 [Bryocella elongata]